MNKFNKIIILIYINKFHLISAIHFGNQFLVQIGPIWSRTWSVFDILFGSNVVSWIIHNAFHEICKAPEKENFFVPVDLKLRPCTYFELSSAAFVTNNWNYEFRFTRRFWSNWVARKLPNCPNVQLDIWNNYGLVFGQ